MPIAGVIIFTVPEQVDRVLSDLQEVKHVTTYGIHKDNNIVAVLETASASELKELSGTIKDKIPGIIDIYPSYVNYEDVEN